jgi:SAM-dependent methyltransferase
LYWPQDRTGGSGCGPQATEVFHEEPAYPKYNDLDSIRSFIETMRKKKYARLLQEAIPYNASVLEVGCRTGDLANFLGTAFRRVIGTDLGMDSLRLANRFRQEQGLNRVRFLQANLSCLPFRESQFDVILVNGGIQRAGDPRREFEEVVHLLKPGGHIVVGLPGRTRGEAPDWFGSTDVEFVRCEPPLDNDERPLEEIRLFTPEPRCSAWSRLWFQARNAIAGNRDGGFFMLVGRKPDAPQAMLHEPDRSTV